MEANEPQFPPFRPGDRAWLLDYPGRYGTVLLVMREEVWLDVNPGAVGGYEWVLAHFPHSWCHDRTEMHAVNRIRPDRLKPMTDAEYMEMLASRHLARKEATRRREEKEGRRQAPLIVS